MLQVDRDILYTLHRTTEDICKVGKRAEKKNQN